MSLAVNEQVPPSPALSTQNQIISCSLLTFAMEQVPSLNHIARKLKRAETRGLLPILQSIRTDAAFVEDVQSKFPSLPVLANLRCGRWYVKSPYGTCYFKSVDGHYNNWQLNTNRLNLHIVPIIAKHHGCIIVDSTRKGKQFPDSFTRTIPIWCCALNRALVQLSASTKSEQWDLSLPTPISVNAREVSQIESRMSGFVSKIFDCGIDLSELKKLRKPLRPLFLSPNSFDANNLFELSEDLPFYPLILLCASAARSNDGGYIQGAADDEESWSMGLTAEMFWRYESEIISVGEKEIEARVEEIVLKCKPERLHVSNEEQTKQSCQGEKHCEEAIVRIPGTRIHFVQAPQGVISQLQERFMVVDCTDMAALLQVNAPFLLRTPLKTSKKEKVQLESYLGRTFEFLATFPTKDILVISSDTIQTAIAMALAITLHLYTPAAATVDKPLVRKWLLTIQSVYPLANPPGVLMREINRAFMTPADLKPYLIAHRKAET